jgi:putative transposase
VGSAHHLPISESRSKKREGDIWQRRYWEHTIRDISDFERHLDYIHYNPVKHGHARCPHEWAHSSFDKWVEKSVYKSDWCCSCGGRIVQPPDFQDIEFALGE